jgi:hypothetical protein
VANPPPGSRGKGQGKRKEQGVGAWGKVSIGASPLARTHPEKESEKTKMNQGNIRWFS